MRAFLLLFALFSAGGAPPEGPAALQVLMIGNSYTAQVADSLAGFVLADPQAAGLLGRATRGGWTTLDHYSSRLQPSYDGASLLERLRARDWDVVIVQEQSTRPSSAWLGTGNERAAFRAGMTNLAAFIRQEAPGAQLVCFQTWPRNWGHAWLAQYFQGRPRLMQQATNAAYARAATLTLAGVIPVGTAWATAMHFAPGLALHAADGSHPGPAGRYLGGAVFFAFLFDRSPAGSPYTGGLPAADRNFLLSVADEIWRDLGG